MSGMFLQKVFFHSYFCERLFCRICFFKIALLCRIFDMSLRACYRQSIVLRALSCRVFLARARWSHARSLWGGWSCRLRFCIFLVACVFRSRVSCQNLLFLEITGCQVCCFMLLAESCCARVQFQCLIALLHFVLVRVHICCRFWTSRSACFEVQL